MENSVERQAPCALSLLIGSHSGTAESTTRSRIRSFEPGNRDHLGEDGHELLNTEHKSGKIEQPGLRAGVDQQIEVTASRIAPGDRPENADVADAVPAAYLLDLIPVRS